MLSAEMAANTIENCIKTNKGFKAESLQEYQTKFHNQHKSTWKFLSIIQKAFRFPFIVNTFILIAKAPFISSIFNSLVGKTYSKYLNNNQNNSR
jgi:flavin-dependent dehydrogenase